LPPYQPYGLPQQSEQENHELQQEPGIQQEVEQQDQHV